MRVFLCVIPLLCGCSTPAVRCDAHLLPINPPTAAVSPTPAQAATDGSTP
ncbi:MAG TPA: hypothetical protein VII35_09380 [Steroidobacteraceae bacterium]